MAKAKVTNKWLKENFNIITIGYCDLQYLLDYFSPAYYTCGIYGWNCDVYIVKNNTVICTGYRPPAGKRIKYDILREYDRQAENITYDYTIRYKEKKKIMQTLLNELLDKVMEVNNNE